MRTIAVRITRPTGSADYWVRAEVIEGHHVLAKMSRKMRVPSEEPVLLDEHTMHAVVQGVLDELLTWHSEGQQLSIF